jgi:hypothetical protein
MNDSSDNTPVYEYWSHDRFMAAIERIKQYKAERLREPLTLEQRSAMLSEACKLADELERNRIAAGGPPSEPAPWPQSTIDFMRHHAQKFRQKSEAEENPQLPDSQAD